MLQRWILCTLLLLILAPDVEAGSPTASGESDPSSVAHPERFITLVAGDFRHLLTTRENLVLLAAGLGGSALISPLDDRIARSRFNAELYEDTVGDRVFEAGEVAGGTAFQLGGALTTYAIGRLTARPDLAVLGRDLLRSQLLSQSLTQVLKYSVRRTRPDGSSRTSYPSGHSSSAFATATVLYDRLGPRAGLASYGLAAYVAASRLSENKHYASDVVLGAAIGIIAGRTVARTNQRTRLTWTPFLTEGGGGLGVLYTP